MGLKNALGRYAVSRVHLLLVEAPGGWLTRIRVEAEVARRGWQVATSPADADVLAICGVPGGAWGAVIDQLWEQMPGPRVRADVATTGTDVAAQLDRAAAELRDEDRHRRDARNRPIRPDIGDMDHGDMDHGDMDHGDMDHGDMDHGDMGMAPDGIPLAEGARDRDGLEMDVMHLRLGPVLAHWPAGLMLDVSLQGDVITQAEAARDGDDDDDGLGTHRAPPHTGPSRDEREPDDPVLEAIWRCDNIARMLALTGWDQGAARARTCRNRLLIPGEVSSVVRSLTRLRRQADRSRSLRWSLDGVGRISEDDVDGLHLPRRCSADSYLRLLNMVDRCVEALSPGGSAGRDEAGREEGEVSAESVASLLVGLEFATARLLVASLDLPPVRATATRSGYG